MINVCKRGHELTGDNVYVAPNGFRRGRECIKCRKLRHFGYDQAKMRLEKVCKTCPTCAVAR